MLYRPVLSQASDTCCTVLSWITSSTPLSGYAFLFLSCPALHCTVMA